MKKKVTRAEITAVLGHKPHKRTVKMIRACEATFDKLHAKYPEAPESVIWGVIGDTLKERLAEG